MGETTGNDHVCERRRLLDRLMQTRRRSLQLAEPLTDEDQTVQASDDASPTKWHLAHTTWFHEAFVLPASDPGYKVYSQAFLYCFNSYYEAMGPRQPRAKRGLLTRPTAAEVRDYRQHVDGALGALVAAELTPALSALIELGIQHEQQHQELLLTDILALFAQNPLRPAYRALERRPSAEETAARADYIPVEGGIVDIGHRAEGFAFDNEGPAHRALLEPYSIASHCVTNAEWRAFMADGGYTTPSLWLADGWACVQREGWQAPGYWEMGDGCWLQMGLDGLHPPEPAAPVCHVSYFEADAFARWAGKRLPTEAEWEHAARRAGDTAQKPASLRPRPSAVPLGDLFGEVWQWTSTAYSPYPGFRPAAGAVGEYNGKFMCNQWVLRGSSCFTPPGHARATYRNFFYPHQRWQMLGLRLAEYRR